MSLSFDGVNDFVSIANQGMNDGITLAAWIKPAGLGESSEGRICSHGVGISSRARFYVAATATVRFAQDFSGTDGVWAAPSNSVPLDTWTHVLVVYTGGGTGDDPLFYINGVSVAVSEIATPTGTIVSDPGTLTLYVGGNSTTDRTFDGLIGEFAHWSTPFVSNQPGSILMNGVLSATQGSLLQNYWPMDDTGTAQATDFSGLGHHGTITGAVLGENPPIRPAGRRG